MSDQMDLVMAQIGAIPAMSPWKLWWYLRPGRQVTRVDWRGCMATERHAEKVGTLKYREQRKLNDNKYWDGIVVRYDGDDYDQWEVLDRVRFVGKTRDVEVW